MLNRAFSIAICGVVTTLSLGAIGITSAQAASVSRADFDASATTFDFESTLPGSPTATDGNLTVINGLVQFTPGGSYGLTSGIAYYDGSDSSVISFSFLNPVSAFGLDFIANNANITLSIFDSANSLIESLTIDWTTLPIDDGFPTGFIGLNAGSNTIAFATIDTPLDGNELLVDNLIYQPSASTPVPTPALLPGLVGMGVAALRKRQQEAKEA